jgi:hypothetical protein
MNCAGSVTLIGDEKSVGGQEAMRGTAAHKIVEVSLTEGCVDASAYLGAWVLVHSGDLPAILVESNDHVIGAEPDPGWYAFLVNEDMVAGVQIMLDEVERVRATLSGQPTLYTERYLDGSWLDSRLGGTADVTLVEDFGWIHLLDYKNGRIVVEVNDNEQLKQYGVFLLHEHQDADGVRITVVQPNAPHAEGVTRTVEYTRDELKIFELQMKEAADATSAPNAMFRVGDWCTYCPAKLRCATFNAAIQEEAVFDFTDEPAPLDAQGSTGVADYGPWLARKARWIPMIDQWCRDILAAIEAELIAGNPVEGKKLVRTKPHRKWIATPQQIVTALFNSITPRIDEALLWEEPSIKSPAQIEKLGKGKQKTKIKEVVSELAAAPLGQLVVADSNDPRAEVDLIAEATSDFPAEEEWSR